MVTPQPTTPATILADLEDLWRCLDELIGTFHPSDWSRKHGKDWTLADVPYHLAYFDRDIIATPIERGGNVPAAEQRVMRTMKELDAWNAQKFAQRPATQTPQQSVQQMRAARDSIRRLVSQMSDADLNRPAFVPLDGCGWLPVHVVLEACRAHTWEEYEELRLIMERMSPRPSDRVTHATLGFFMGFMSMMLDREEAKRTRFTLVTEITGPGRGAWTMRVGDGGFTLTEERAADADVVMTQSSETFLKTWVGWLDPMTAMQTGEIKVQGMENMGAFAKLFPPLTPDTVIEPMGAPEPWS